MADLRGFETPVEGDLGTVSNQSSMPMRHGFAGWLQKH
jgi:hypothetical protein